MKNQLEIPEAFRLESLDFSKLSACFCIVIDGDDGAGKTRSAKRLAQLLGAEVIAFDDFLLGNTDPYCEQMDYVALRSKISTGRQKVILEGVCALKVLAKIGVHHDYLIFMKRYCDSLGWEYGHWLAGKEELPQGKLQKEILQYYEEFRPFKICNVELSL